ncbi:MULTISPECIES: xanthine phosphoribosyltransferase [Lactobacillus]|uniref:xanthine phosphoribosyltransferase n=1 Tax=Lactobacillus TaxID=1578 RepID=UPI00164EDB87|nr:xanthine phosphoribosyltransferase [Lactobacillus melliventris]MBC6349194.1 xanthine phosphoribosyltransferase [Lactobacillus melliventris]MBH9989686.1 xanthine phosphoribosyltransferase [Lactobacillus sp. M0392]MBI0024269.1 xanthine phosphoribosyltransferase [Lactobacillus sp. W8171]MBI0044727.1 xanthine phosphoribosyltransferase [Lactobacillus sp. M0393]
MKLLEDRIRSDGEVLPGNVLKINSFLNHQVDPELMKKVGEEFSRLFKDSGVTKVLTCEASGIAPGIMAAYELHVPMVFARKKKPATLNDAVYWADVYSYTKKVTNQICVEQKFLHKDDHLLIIDDFLANGEAVKGMINIANQAGAEVAGVGIVVAKTFQGGSDWIKEHGYRLEALAEIASLANNQVRFVGEN